MPGRQRIPFGQGAKDADPNGEEVMPIPLEDSLDLHSFYPRDIPEVIEEYLRACQRAGFTEVRIIHGRGIGVQRKIVQSLLVKMPGVSSFRDAPAERGGWGATLVYLQGARLFSPHQSEEE